MTTARKYNVDGMTFDEWLAAANEETAKHSDGLTLDDLPDRATWDAWDAGEDPRRQAREWLAEEFPFLDF
jgi:hypothetical protein